MDLHHLNQLRHNNHKRRQQQQRHSHYLVSRNNIQQVALPSLCLLILLTLSHHLTCYCQAAATTNLFVRDAHDDSSHSFTVPTIGENEQDFIEEGYVVSDQLSDSIEDERRSIELMQEEEEHGEKLTTSTSQAQKTKQLFKIACPHGFFACQNGECISPKWRCDGHYDCDDFSDELNCTIPETDNRFGGKSSSSTILNVSNNSKAASSKSQQEGTTGMRQQSPPPPPPMTPQEEISELKFNSSQEPLMLFSTGTSIRGYWMRSRIYFDITSMTSRPPISSSAAPSITQAFSIFFDMFSNADRDVPSSSSSSSSSSPRAGSSSSSSSSSSLASDSTSSSIAFKPRSTIVGVDMDPNDKQVFWVELGKDPGVYSTIIEDDQFNGHHRRQIDGLRRKTLVDSGLLSPEDVALDIIGKNIYITDAGLQAIVVCSIRQSQCKILAQEGLHKPRALIVDSATGWLTYTDWGDHPGIFLVSMDGKKREVLIDTDVVWPNGLASDYASNQLYWADARLSKIERVDLVTRKRKEIVRESGANPFSLSLFENRIYWSDWSGNDIKTCDKTQLAAAIAAGTANTTTKTIMRTENIYGIHIFHPTIYGKSFDQENPCWSMHCSHICLLSPVSASFANRRQGNVLGTCACPESMTLSITDKISCYETRYSFLLVNVRNYVAQFFPEKIGLGAIHKVISSRDHEIHDIATDWNNYRVFFYDASKQEIFSVDMTESNSGAAKFEPFFQVPTGQSVTSLLFDPYSDNLYWLDFDKGTLSMCSTTSRIALFDHCFQTQLRKDLGQPTSMVLDSKNRVFYIAMLDHDMPHIMRTDIFAQQKSDLIIIGADIGAPISLHLDERKQRLYWADKRHETIESVDLDLSPTSTSGIKQYSRIVHRTGLGQIVAFAVYRDEFVWTVESKDYLHKAPIGDLQTVSDEGGQSQWPPVKPLPGIGIHRMAGGSGEEPRPVSFKLPPSSPTTFKSKPLSPTPSRVSPFTDLMSSNDKRRIILVEPSHASFVTSPCHKRDCPHGCVLAANQSAICFQPSSRPEGAADTSNSSIATSAANSAAAASTSTSAASLSGSPQQQPQNHHDNEFGEPEASGIIVTEPNANPSEGSGFIVWFIVVLLVFLFISLVAIVYKQGRLPRQVSQLSVSFSSMHQSNHNKDGAMLLLDNDELK